MSKIKVLALFGKSGSGKDTIQRWMTTHLSGTKRIVGCTTRPPRSYEQDGVDYYFITPDEFLQEVLNNEIIEAAQFNSWFYGTRLSELDEDKINVGVFNIPAIECLLADGALDVLPVQIETDDLTRLKRNLDREVRPDCAEICRRFLADEKDFDDIPFDYATFDNCSSNADWFGIYNVPAVKEFFADSGQN